MKAIILAAGFGNRLRPLTLHTPKCLAPINGKPLLAYWLENCSRCGINEILINTHHLAGLVIDYINQNAHLYPKMDIHTVYEKRLLGTAGTVWANQEFVGQDNCFIITGDVLSNVNLSYLYDFHLHQKYALTLGYVIRQNPEDCGVLEIDNESRIVRFEEKPEYPFGQKTYSGIQVINGAIFKLLPFKSMQESDYMGLDFGYNVWPKLVGKMSGYHLDCYLKDIGNIETYNQAQSTFPEYYGNN